MQTFDLTRVRNYSGSTLTLPANSLYTGVTRIHTLAVNPQSGWLYAVGTNRANGGLHAINVNNPLAPVAAADWSIDGYTHETQVVTYDGPDTQHVGKEIAFNANGNSNRLVILDVTNKASITKLSSKTYPNAGYTHQGWLTDDKRFFIVNDEFDEIDGVTGGKTATHVWDVRDLDNPIYKGRYIHQTTSIDHNLYVKGGYVYMSNYTTGLRVLKIGDLAGNDPQYWFHEVAWLDTYPANDAAQFSGAWNNYPFFPSGNIAISDINGGLFVTKVRPEAFTLQFSTARGGLAVVPEPASLLAIAGMAAAGLMRRR
jgi:choice-of-anchor B domain-containing protein